jgi:hypothetical protein
MSKTKNERRASMLDAEVHLRTRLAELESAEYLLSYLRHLISDGYGDNVEVNNATYILSSQINRHKCRTWENIAMLSPVSSAMQAMLEAKLRTKVDDATNDSMSEFLGRSWTHIATDEDTFKRLVQERLLESMRLKTAALDANQVPKRELSPDL